METAYAHTGFTQPSGYVITAQNIMSQCQPIVLSGSTPYTTTFDFHTLDRTGYPPYGNRVGQSTNGMTYPPSAINWHVDGSFTPSLNPGTAFAVGQGIQLVENTSADTTLQTVVTIKCTYLTEIPSSKIQLLLNTPEYKACNTGVPATDYPTGFVGTRVFSGQGIVPHIQKAVSNIQARFPAANSAAISNLGVKVATTAAAQVVNPTTSSVPVIVTPPQIASTPVVNVIQGTPGSAQNRANTAVQASGGASAQSPANSLLSSLTSGLSSGLGNLPQIIDPKSIGKLANFNPLGKKSSLDYNLDNLNPSNFFNTAGKSAGELPALDDLVDAAVVF